MGDLWRCLKCHGPWLAADPDGQKPWKGPCPNCGHVYRAEAKWDGAGEDPDEEPNAPDAVSMSQMNRQAKTDPVQTLPTGCDGFDWMMGGGLPMVGIGVLLAGPGGSGKSQWSAELLRSITRRGARTLYISSEESLEQLHYRLARLGAFPDRMRFTGKPKGDTGMDIKHAIDNIEKWKPRVAVVDSLHDLSNVADDNWVTYSKGSQMAVSLAANRLRALAMDRRMVIIMVSHVTKGGDMTGSNDIQHDTDVPLYLSGKLAFENGAWKIPLTETTRLLSFHGKLRYGEPGRRVLYEMASDGLHDKGPWMRSTLPWEKSPMTETEGNP